MERFLRQLRWALGVSLLLLVTLVAIDVTGAHAEPTPADDTAQIQAPATAGDAIKKDGDKGTGSPTSMEELRDSGGKTPLHQRLLAIFGVVVLIGIAWLLSRDRKAIKWRPVLWGIALQVAFGLIVLSPTVGKTVFKVVNKSVNTLMSFSEKGTDFVFQSIEPHEVTTVNLQTKEKKTETYIGRISPSVKTVAFWILPTIIFFSALMNLLYHLGIMQFMVRGAEWIMQRTMGTSGAESLSAAANIFVGQTEAPMVVKPYIETMTLSELHAVMVGGFATVAGGVLAAYVGFLQSSIPDIAGHLVMASIMSAPAALAISKIMCPETGKPATAGGTTFKVEKDTSNAIEAVAKGSTDGLKLFLNVLAMLIAFVAMVAMLNFIIAWVGSWFGWDITLELLLGYLFAPLAWTMGVPWDECRIVGQLLGEKLVLTELIAYGDLAQNLSGPNPISPRSAIICSYALCGFANFASIGIQIGGIGGIAPGRTKELAKIGLMAMIGGALAANMTGTIAGIIL